jgi:hypothetical protein
MNGVLTLKMHLEIVSGCRESNPVIMVPNQAYYRYTTARA